MEAVVIEICKENRICKNVNKKLRKKLTNAINALQEQEY